MEEEVAAAPLFVRSAVGWAVSWGVGRWGVHTAADSGPEG